MTPGKQRVPRAGSARGTRFLWRVVSSALRIPALLLALLLVAHATPEAVRAQLPVPLLTNDRVRVTLLDGDRVVGRFVGYGDDRLHLRTMRGPESLDRSSIARLQVSVGREHALGAVAGAATGLAAGLALGYLCSTVRCGGGGGAGPSLAIIGFPLVGVPAGAVVGWWLLAPDRWVEARKRTADPG